MNFRPLMHPTLARLLLTGCLLLPLPAQALDWLDVRRRGADAIVALGRERTAEKGWTQVYRSEAAPGTPLAGVKLQITRAYAGKAQLSVRVVAGPPTLVGLGVVIDGERGWIRVPGEKVKPLPQETIFRPLPVLEVPMVAFCALDWQRQYEATLEGEFDQVAVVRLIPRYELGVTARPAKVSISKTDGHLLATAVNDGKGNPLGEVVWMYAPRSPLVTPSHLELHGPGGKAAKITRFVAEGPSKPVAKNAFAAGALK